MEIKLRCLSCRKNYYCHKSNTKMFGPLIETICPNCKNLVMKNTSAFLADQTNYIELKLSQTCAMLVLGIAIENTVGNEEAYKKKKKLTIQVEKII